MAAEQGGQAETLDSAVARPAVVWLSLGTDHGWTPARTSTASVACSAWQTPKQPLTCVCWCRCTSRCCCAQSWPSGGQTDRRRWTWQMPSCVHASAWHQQRGRFRCWPEGRQTTTQATEVGVVLAYAQQCISTAVMSAEIPERAGCFSTTGCFNTTRGVCYAWAVGRVHSLTRAYTLTTYW